MLANVFHAILGFPKKNLIQTKTIFGTTQRKLALLSLNLLTLFIHVNAALKFNIFFWIKHFLYNISYKILIRYLKY